MDRGSMRALAPPPSSVAVDTICPAKILQLKKIEKVVTKWSPSGCQVVPKGTQVDTKWSSSGHQVFTKWSPSGCLGYPKGFPSGKQVVTRLCQLVKLTQTLTLTKM